jgi:hypothetical protein
VDQRRRDPHLLHPAVSLTRACPPGGATSRESAAPGATAHPRATRHPESRLATPPSPAVGRGLRREPARKSRISVQPLLGRSVPGGAGAAR